MQAMDRLTETLEKELEKIADKGSINETDLGHVDKLTHSIKSIETIQAMRDSGYSNGYPYDGGNSYRYQRRDSMGRYSRDDYSNARWGRDGDGDGRYNERYSREDGYSRDNLREKLERMMNEAQSEKERDSLRMALQNM